MTKMRTLLLAACALALVPLAGALAGSGTITTKDAAGTTRTFVVTTDGSGNFVSQTVICDQSAAASCAAVANNAMGIDILRIGGTLVTAGSGTVTAGTIRTTQASDSPLITGLGAIADSSCSTDTGSCSLIALMKRNNANLTSGTITTGTAGTPSTMVLTVQGTTTMSPMLVNPGTAANWGIGPTASAVPANGLYVGVSVGGNLVGLIGDPCETVAATYTPIAITTATTTRIIAPTSAKKTYICGMFLVSGAANNIAVVEGTGGTCGSSTAGVVGGTTAANGLILAANEGFMVGNGGKAVWATAGTNVDFCLITSATGTVAGHVKWVAQ